MEKRKPPNSSRTAAVRPCAYPPSTASRATKYSSAEGGDKYLSSKQASWDDFFDASPKVPANFIFRRKDARPQKRRLFK